MKQIAMKYGVYCVFSIIISEGKRKGEKKNNFTKKYFQFNEMISSLCMAFNTLDWLLVGSIFMIQTNTNLCH